MNTNSSISIRINISTGVSISISSYISTTLLLLPLHQGRKTSGIWCCAAIWHENVRRKVRPADHGAHVTALVRVLFLEAHERDPVTAQNFAGGH